MTQSLRKPLQNCYLPKTGFKLFKIPFTNFYNVTWKFFQDILRFCKNSKYDKISDSIVLL